MTRIGVIAALAAGCVTLSIAVGGAVGSPGAATWSGRWSGASYWDFTQSGSTVTGIWQGSASNGTMTGTVLPGGVMHASFTNKAAGGIEGTWDVTLAPDGLSFNGTYTQNSATYSWFAACVSGACLQNKGTTVSTVPTPTTTKTPCKAGTADADGKPANGCEVNLLSDPNNCGAVGVKVPVGEKCVDGKATKPTTTTAASPSSRQQNIHQGIPDFWIMTSNHVITRNVIGIDTDGALTAGARNDQVLTVNVLERSTGCLISRVMVVFQDPKYVKINGHETGPEGDVDLGVGRNLAPGLYHVWVHGDDAEGNILEQATFGIWVRAHTEKTFTTINGRVFNYVAGNAGGAEWQEEKRTLASNWVAAGNPVEWIVNGLKSALSGLVDRLKGSAKTQATAAVSTLNGKAAKPEVKVLTVQVKNDISPVILQTTATPQPVEQKLVDGKTSAQGVISNDGASIISTNGTGIISTNGTGIIADNGGGLLTKNAQGIVAQGGGNIVAQGGGNIVAQGAGNIVAQGAGNIVAQGGGNLVGNSGGTLVKKGAHAATSVRYGACISGSKGWTGKVKIIQGSPVMADSDGKILPGTLVIGGRNEMPINGPAPK